MKTLIFFAVIAFAAGDSKFYNLPKASINVLVNDTVALQNLIDCFLDRAPCSDTHSTYKAVAEESVKQKCTRCTPHQKLAFWMFLQVMTTKFPGDYVNFRQKYDPENKYFQDLETELSKSSNAL